MRQRSLVLVVCCCLPLLALATPAEARIGGGHSYSGGRGHGSRSRGGSGHHAGGAHGRGNSGAPSAGTPHGTGQHAGSDGRGEDPLWSPEFTMLVSALLCMALFWVLAKVSVWREDALLYDDPHARRSLRPSVPREPPVS